MLALLRFLHVVDGLPGWMWMATATVAAYAVVVVWMDPPGADSALGALLLWQMLSASRGFVKPASSGHFDPILIRESRVRIAIAHLAHATVPVIAAWVLVGALEIALGVSRPRAVEPGRMAALAFVSAAAWALSLGSARLVTGTLWLTGLAGLAVTPVGLSTYASLRDRPEGVPQLLHALALAMACPFVMIDVALPMRTTVAAGLALAAALAASAGVAFIARRSYPLESSL